MTEDLDLIPLIKELSFHIISIQKFIYFRERNELDEAIGKYWNVCWKVEKLKIIKSKFTLMKILTIIPQCKFLIFLTKF